MTTISDVARMANVSGATVSHVINKTRKVNPETIMRVEKAIAVLDYHPNSQARELKTGISNLIGVINISSIDPFFSEVLNGLERSANASGYGVLLRHSEFSNQVQMDNLDLLIRKNIDGLIINSPIMSDAFTEAIRKLKCPCLLLQYYDENLPVDYIHTDDMTAAYETTSYLIALGHTRIACIAGFAYPQHSAFHRRAGYEKALKEHNIPVNHKYFVTTHYTIQEGFDQFNHLRSLNKPPTAFITYSDLLALGAVRAATDNGYSIPEDISIIGFDDIEISSFTVPRLTTVFQEKSLMGQLAFERIRGRISDPTLLPERKILPARLVIRESCGPARHK